MTVSEISKKRFTAIVTGTVALTLAASALMINKSARAEGTWLDSSYYDYSWYDPMYTTCNIDTEAQLAGLAYLVNNNVDDFDGGYGKLFQINNDLDLSSHNWVPIGTESNPFKGTLTATAGTNIDGVIIKENYQYTGFVGYAEGATIGGFELSGTYTINGDEIYAGAAVGCAKDNSVIYSVNNNIEMDVTGSGNVFVGGVVGCFDGYGEMADLKNYVSIKAESSNTSAYVGGIVGLLRNSTDGQSIKLDTVVNEGDVTSTAENGDAAAAAFVGMVGQDGAITLSAVDPRTPATNTGTITARGSCANAAAVFAYADDTAKLDSITGNYTNTEDGKIVAEGKTESYAGGFMARIEKDFVFDAAFENKGEISNTGGTLYTGGLAGYVNGDFTTETDNKNSGELIIVSETGAYTGSLVGSVTGDFKTGHITLENNAALGVTVNTGDAYTGGIVGYAGSSFETEQTVLQNNAALDAETFNGDAYTGGIIGYAGGSSVIDTNTISSNANITAKASNDAYTGGFMGYTVGDTSVSNTVYSTTSLCKVDAKSGNDAYTAGMIGYAENNTNLASEVSNDAEITVVADNNANTGGIVGNELKGVICSDTSIVKSTQDISVDADGEAYTAAFVGKTSNIEIYNVSYENKITVNAEKGNHTAGIAGSADMGIISTAAVNAATLNITGNKSYIGGIIGESTDADNSLVITGVKISGITIEADGEQAYVGSVVGKGDVSLTLGSTDAPVEVTGNVISLINNNKGYTGGVIGWNNSTSVYTKISDIKISGDTFKESCAGGVIGYNENAALTAENLVLTEKVNMTVGTPDDERDNFIGGVIGKNVNSNLNDIKAQSVTIKADSNASEQDKSAVGGIVGRMESSSADSLEIKEVSITSDGDGTDVGALLGYTNSDIINPRVYTDSYNYIYINGKNNVAGGIVGRADGDGTADTIKGKAIPGEYNISKLIIVAGEDASDALIGGAVGNNVKMLVDGIYTNGMLIRTKADNGIIGGITGLNLGTEYAVTQHCAFFETNIETVDGADYNAIGGSIGENLYRGDALDKNIDYQSAISTVKDLNVTGNINISSSGNVIGGGIGSNSSLISEFSVTDQLNLNIYGTNNYAGGVAGENKYKLYFGYSNCLLSTGGTDNTTGGIVGHNVATGSVETSYRNTDISSAAVSSSESFSATSVTDHSYVAGLVGMNEGVIDKCYVNAALTATGKYSFAGGLVGLNYNGGSITDSYTAGYVTATAEQSYAGGFAGRIINASIKYCYSATKVNNTADVSFRGGFAGRYDDTNKDLLSYCVFIKDENQSADKQINAAVMDFGGGDYYEIEAPAKLRTATDLQLSDRTTFIALTGWSGFDSDNPTWTYGSLNASYRYPELVAISGIGENNTNYNINWYTKDKSASVFYIGTEQELGGLSAIVNGTVSGYDPFNFDGRTIKITAPINVQIAQWTPIGVTEDRAFMGAIDGQNNLISGFRVSTSSDYSGLFGYVGTNSIIENFRLEPISVIGGKYVGSLAAYNKGIIRNSNILLDAAVVNSFSDDAIIGGVIGYNSGTINNITLEAKNGSMISANGANADLGGIIGKYDKGTDSDIAHVFGVKFDDTSSISADNTNITAGGVIGSFNGTNWSDSQFTVTGLNIASTSGRSGGVFGYFADTQFDNTTYSVTDLNVKQTEKSDVSTFIGFAKNAKLMTINASADLTAVMNGGNAALVAANADSTYIYEADINSNGINIVDIGDVTVGGIAGYMNDSDSNFNETVDSGSYAKIYQGINCSKISGTPISVNYAGIGTEPNNKTATIGGVIGYADSISVYNTTSDMSIVQSYTGEIGFDIVRAGRMAGMFANGSYAIGNNVYGSIKADSAVSFRLGGFAGETASGSVLRYNSSSANEADNIQALFSRTDNPMTMVGGFIGKAEATDSIANDRAYVSVDVQDTNKYSRIYAGGFAGAIGQDDYVTVTSSEAEGKVTVNAEGYSYAGGFAGYTYKCNISYAYALGDVDNNALNVRSGGFAGSTAKYTNINSAYAVDQIIKANNIDTSTTAYAGGFAGYNNAIVTQVYADAKNIESGSGNYIGALTGYIYDDGKITESYISSDSEWPSFEKDSKDRNGYHDITAIDLTDRNASSKFDFGIKVGHDNGWSFIKDENSNRPVLAPLSYWGTSSDLSVLYKWDQIVIRNANEAGIAAKLMNELDFFKLIDRNATQLPVISSITLADNIDLSGQLWKPIYNMYCDFNGEGFAINGITMYAKDYSGYGFVNYNTNSIKKVDFTNAEITSQDTTGIAAAINCDAQTVIPENGNGAFTTQGDGGIYSVTASGTILYTNNENKGYFGGITADNRSILGSEESKVSVSDIKIIPLNENVTVADYIGGIAGHSKNTVSYATAKNIEISGNDYVGGAIGKSDADCDNITVTAPSVSGHDYVGGINGYTNGSITGSKISGAVLDGNKYIGGVTGYITGDITDTTAEGTFTITADADYVGGIAGYTIGNVAANGTYNAEITSDDSNYVGGVVGCVDAVKAITLTGKINNITLTGINYVGGIAGYTKGSIANAVEGTVSVTATGDYVGGTVGLAEGKVSDVTIESSTVSGNDYVGGAVGRGNTDNNNIVITASTATGNDYIGGVIGYSGGAVKSVEAVAAVVTGNDYVGGIVGWSDGSVTSAKIGDSTITGNIHVGGIVGHTNEIISEIESYGAMVVNAASDYVGGITGYAANDVSGAISGSVTINSENSSYVGGAVGYLSGNHLITITGKCGNITLSGVNYIGGVAGYTEGSIKNVELGDISATATGDFAGGIAGEAKGDIDSIITGNIAASATKRAAGITHEMNTLKNITVNGNVTVTANDDNIGGLVGISHGDVSTVSVTGTIILNGTEQKNNIGGIAGNVSGNVSGITIGTDGKGDINIIGVDNIGGVVGYVTGNISDVSMASATVDGKNNIGGVVGYAEGTVKTVKMTGAGLTGNDNVGGVAGYVKGEISDITASGTTDIVAKGSYVGGVAGKAESTVHDITIHTVKANGKEYTGGIAGSAKGDVSKCEVTLSNVNVANNYSGGAVGYTAGSVYDVNVADSTVFGYDYVGGIVGYSEGEVKNSSLGNAVITAHSNAGGIVGYTVMAITDVEITGTTSLTAEGDYIGGIIGYAQNDVTGKILGSVTISSESSSYVGGAVGYMLGEHNITIGGMDGDITLHGVNYIGGIAGYTDGSIKDINLSNINVTANGDYAGGIAGESKGDIDNIITKNITASATKRAAGITHEMNTLTNITVNGDINISANDNNIGGLVGLLHSDASTITVSGSITINGVDEKSQIGGIVGNAEGNITGVTVGTNGGKITIKGKDNVGGIAGGNTGSLSKITINSSEVIGNENVGGISAYTTGSAFEITVLGDVTVNSTDGRAGGISGSIGTDISDVEINGSVNVTAVNDYAGGIAGNVNGNASDITITGNSLVSSNGNYIAGQFGNVTGSIEKASVNGELTVKSLGNYVGGIAGNSGNTVSEITVAASVITGGSYSGGIAGYSGGKISGVQAQKLSVNPSAQGGEEYLGGIAGYTVGGIDTVSVAENIDVSGNNYIGCIAGYSNADIKNVTINADVTAAAQGDYAGGIAGSINGTVDTLTMHNAAVSSSTGSYVGGIVGSQKSTGGYIANVSADEVNISAVKSVGGIAGTLEGSINKVSIAKVIASAQETIGGATPNNGSGMTISDVVINDIQFTGTAGKFGGIVQINNGTITNARIRNAVAAQGNYVGGIAAENNGTIEKSYIRGTITLDKDYKGAEYGGGIAAVNNGTISECFSDAPITIQAYRAEVGGIAGENTGIIKDCYSSSRSVLDVTGSENVFAGGIAGLSTNGAVNNCMAESTIIGTNSDAMGKNHLVGAIAGQIKAGTVSGNVFDKQGSGTSAAWYNADLAAIGDEPFDGGKMLYTNQLITGKLPSELENEKWTATENYYPALTAFVTTVDEQDKVIAQESVKAEAKDYFADTDTIAYGKQEDAPEITYSSTSTDINVTIKSASAYSAVYYTVNDGEMKLYTEPFTLHSDSVVKAIAVEAGFNDSTIAETKVLLKKASTGGGGGGGGGGGSTSAMSAVNIKSANGGTIATDKDKAWSGTEVFVTVTPDNGYTLESIQIKDESDTEVKYTINADGVYVFKMPSKNVTISAVFAKSEDPTATEKPIPEPQDNPVKTKWNPFNDVTEDLWFYNNVKYVYENGYMDGMEENEFKPYEDITRGMFVTVLYRVEGSPSVSGKAFEDVASSEYYFNAVVWASQNKIVDGFNDEEFKPNNKITREQMAVVLCRYAASKGVDVNTKENLSYTDSEDVSGYAKPSVIWTEVNHIMSGKSDGIFSPQTNATRAEMAAVLERSIKNIID